MPKKNGKKREINIPDLYLKGIQKAVYFIFQSVYIGEESKHSHGFVPGKSIYSNAIVHTGRRNVLNIDVKNFFDSVTFRRLKITLEFHPFNLKDDKEEIGFVVANLCTLNGVLPQGAPTSPLFSNIVCRRIDKRFSQFAKKRNIRYTRYADDITFSSNYDLSEKDIVGFSEKVLKKDGFSINKAKIRLQNNKSRQIVTGLVVNQKVNVNRSYVRNVRSILFNWENKGIDEASIMFEKDYRKVDRENFSLINVLRGKIAHIGQAKGKDSPIYKKLFIRWSYLKNRILYDVISNEKVKYVLDRDNRLMEDVFVSLFSNEEDKFIEFCTKAFLQVENLVNYYYYCGSCSLRGDCYLRVSN